MPEIRKPGFSNAFIVARLSLKETDGNYRNGTYYGSDLNFSLFWDFCAQFQKKYWKQDKPGEYVVGHHRLSFEGKNHEFFLKILSFFPEPLIMYNLSKTLEFWKFGVR